MRNSALINGFVLSSIVVASSCVGGGIDEETIDSTENRLSAADEMASDQTSAVDEEPPHEITAEQLDANGEVVVTTLSCGLSILLKDEYTLYWIRDCGDSDSIAQVVYLYDDTLFLGERLVIAAYGTVSGSVRGRVLRLRRGT